jgi:hypothetical protein
MQQEKAESGICIQGSKAVYSLNIYIWEIVFLLGSGLKKRFQDLCKFHNS